jgi:integrase
MAAAIWEWLDWKGKTLNVQGRADFGVKDWEARSIPLSSWAISILQPRRKKSGYVVDFRRPREGPKLYHYDTWNELVKKAGYPGLTVLRLRSSFGSMYLQEGVSLSKIALWMGHGSEDVTRKHYAAAVGI